MISSWIVILNWNGREDTLDLLKSLQDADLQPGTTTLVVDNGSTDETLTAVGNQYPWVRTLQTGSNLGYAGGNNRGIEFALAHGADVIGVLNNDTVVSQGFWEPLVTATLGRRAAASPDIRYADRPESTWFYGAMRSRRDGWPRHLDDRAQPPRSGLQDTEIITGCCLVADAETWRMVGTFDEGYFLIFEDADWSMRARNAGIRLILEPRSRILHKVSRSFRGDQSLLGIYYFSRNGLVFAWRWTGPAAAGRFLLTQVFRPRLGDVRNARSGVARTSAVCLIAVAAAAFGRRGQAGPLTQRIATRRRHSQVP